MFTQFNVCMYIFSDAGLEGGVSVKVKVGKLIGCVFDFFCLDWIGLEYLEVDGRVCDATKAKTKTKGNNAKKRVWHGVALI